MGRYHVLYQDTSQIHDLIHRRLSQNMANTNDLWISCSMNVLDSSQFMSKQRNIFGSEVGDGVSVDFLSAFIRSFADESIGLDLSDVNLDITQSDDQLRYQDYETFRDLFEHIVDSIQGSHHIQEQPFQKIKLVVSRPPRVPCHKPKNTKLKTTLEINNLQERYRQSLR